MCIRVAPGWYWRQMVAGGFQQGEVDNESYLFMDTTLGKLIDVSDKGSYGALRAMSNQSLALRTAATESKVDFM